MDNFEYISNRLPCPDTEKENAFAIVQRLCIYANKVRTEGQLSLEPLLAAEPDAFLQDGLRRLIDAESPQDLQQAMRIHILAANATGKRFLEMMVIADGVCQIEQNMHPRTLVSRLSEWFGENYAERFAQVLAELDTEEQRRAAHARTEREALASQTELPDTEKTDEVLVQQDSPAAKTAPAPVTPQTDTEKDSDMPAEKPSATVPKPEATPTDEPKTTVAPHASVVEFHQLGSCGADAITRLLQDVDDDTLAVALKGVDKPLFSLFWSSMSKERCEKLLEKMSSAYHVQTQDVEKAQAQILSTAKELEDKQELSLDFPNGELKAPHWEVIL